MSTQLPIDYKSDIGALEFNAEHARRRFEDAASQGFPANNQVQLYNEMCFAQSLFEAAQSTASTSIMIEPPATTAKPVTVSSEPEPMVFVDTTPLTKSQAKRVASKGEGK